MYIIMLMIAPILYLTTNLFMYNIFPIPVVAFNTIVNKELVHYDLSTGFLYLARYSSGIYGS